ncbi:MAG: NrdJb [Gammaproteobacteria bacterium]
MTKKIDKPIIDASVVKGSATAPASESEESNVVQMHEKVERPEMLIGATYKIKTPHSDHALYVTINDIVLNAGTSHELRRPFEMFINSKSMEHFQWIVALTRIISAVFRKGGDVTFLVEEMRSVFDPKGGYFKKGGRFVPSLVAEIGDVLDSHLRMIGLLRDDPADAGLRAQLAAKRAEYEASLHQAETNAPEDFPDGAVLCQKCLTRAMVRMDNCLTCLNCGESKCG